MKIYIKNVLIEIDILTYSTNNTRNIIMHECSKSALFIYDIYIYIQKNIKVITKYKKKYIRNIVYKHFLKTQRFPYQQQKDDLFLNCLVKRKK